MPRQKKRPQLKQRADGRWRCKYKGIEFYSTISSEDAYRQKDEYVELEKKGYGTNRSNITVKEYAAEWLPRYKSHVRASTYNGYALNLDMLCKYIGSMRMRDVTPSDIAAYYKEKIINLSPVTVKNKHTLYVQMFDTAIDDNICIRNPCTTTSIKSMLPKGKGGTHRIITDEERHLILTVQDRMQLVAMLMLYAGLRKSEALAIQVERDVDFQRKTITVHGTIITETPKGQKAAFVEIGKTKNSIRTIPLFSILEPFLKGRIGKVVSTRSGDYLQKGTFDFAWEQYLKKLSKAAGHTISIRTHDLRHSFCSWAISKGADVHVVSEWMGHSNPSFTQEVYDHVDNRRELLSIKMVEGDDENQEIGGQNGGQKENKLG